MSVVHRGYKSVSLQSEDSPELVPAYMELVIMGENVFACGLSGLVGLGRLGYYGQILHTNTCMMPASTISVSGMSVHTV